MRYRKISTKNNKWTKTCEALKQLFKTLRCSKCKSSLHNEQQFLECGHFTCFSCIKNSNKCIECHFPTNDDILKDDTVKKIIQACCTIAEAVGFKELPQNNETNLEERAVVNTKSSNIEQNSLNSFTSNVNGVSNQPTKGPQNGLKRCKGVKKLTQIDAKKPKLEIIIPKKNVDKKNHVGETKMQQECKKGNIKNVKLLLDAGANPNTSCAAGWTPLQECADYGFIDIAEILLKKGADINKKGYLGRTPLHEAIQAGNITMVKFLLGHNAQKDIEDDELNKPIHYCKSEHIRMLMGCDEGSESPSTSTRARNRRSSKRKCDYGHGVSCNGLKDNHNVIGDILEVERECDNGSEDNEEPSYKEKYSQNITISHEDIKQASSEIDNEFFDTEEIDVLN